MTITTSRPRAPHPLPPVGILAHRLGQLAGQLEAADGVDPALKAGLRAACELASGLDPYLSRWTTPESPALRRLAQRTQDEDWRRHPGDGPAPLEQEVPSG